MSLCGRRQCGGDKGRAAAATWTKMGWIAVWVGRRVGDREQTTLFAVGVLD
jgi:hypothetical protein